LSLDALVLAALAGFGANVDAMEPLASIAAAGNWLLSWQANQKGWDAPCRQSTCNRMQLLLTERHWGSFGGWGHRSPDCDH